MRSSFFEKLLDLSRVLKGSARQALAEAASAKKQRALQERQQLLDAQPGERAYQKVAMRAAALAIPLAQVSKGQRVVVAGLPNEIGKTINGSFAQVIRASHRSSHRPSHQGVQHPNLEGGDETRSSMALVELDPPSSFQISVPVASLYDASEVIRIACAAAPLPAAQPGVAGPSRAPEPPVVIDVEDDPSVDAGDPPPKRPRTERLTNPVRSAVVGDDSDGFGSSLVGSSEDEEAIHYAGQVAPATSRRARWLARREVREAALARNGQESRSDNSDESDESGHEIMLDEKEETAPALPSGLMPLASSPSAPPRAPVGPAKRRPSSQPARQAPAPPLLIRVEQEDDDEHESNSDDDTPLSALIPTVMHTSAGPLALSGRALLALALLDLELALDWAQVSASWKYKQKAWRLRVEAHAHRPRRAERPTSRELHNERRVELPADPLESLRELAIMLCGAIKPRALAVASSWFKIDEWHASVAAASNFPALHELVTLLTCALIGEDEPPARLQTQDEPPAKLQAQDEPPARLQAQDEPPARLQAAQGGSSMSDGAHDGAHDGALPSAPASINDGAHDGALPSAPASINDSAHDGALPSAPASIKDVNGVVGTLLTRSPRRQKPHRTTVKTEPSVKTELDIVKTEPDTVKTEPIVKTEATVKTEAARLSLEVERDYRVKLRARAQGRAQGRGSTDDQMNETPSHSDNALTGAALNWASQQLSVGQCVRARRLQATTLDPAKAFWFSGTIRYVMKLTSDDL